MKISVDGGALDTDKDHKFGTAVFSENLVKALKIYDRKNQYHIYTFANLKPKLFWMKGQVSLAELKQKKEIFLALNQALPVYSSGKIISFSHGLSFYLHPKLYSEQDYSRLKKQLDEMVQRSDKIVVSSIKVKKEFVSMYRYIETKINIIPFGVPFDMAKKNVKHPAFVKTSAGKQKYFLFVGNKQKIKNIDFTIDAFIKSGLNKKGYQLLLVGNWKEMGNKKEGMVSAGNVSRLKLKGLYQQATALLTSSIYESFNFPVLEALSQSCPVIGLKTAIIPELKLYINIAENKNQFISLIEQAASQNLTKVDPKIILKKFSWKNYVGNLVKLY